MTRRDETVEDIGNHLEFGSSCFDLCRADGRVVYGWRRAASKTKERHVEDAVKRVEMLRFGVWTRVGEVGKIGPSCVTSVEARSMRKRVTPTPEDLHAPISGRRGAELDTHVYSTSTLPL